MATDTRLHDVELDITGMTCASCANRIERKLNKLDGVTASVNYATERARVSHLQSVSTDELLATVAAAGYAATLPSDAPVEGEEERGDPELDARVVVDRRALGRVVDARRDALELVELALDAVRARRARHARDRELEMLGGHQRTTCVKATVWTAPSCWNWRNRR